MIGFRREHLREPLARFFYSETPDPGRDPHVIRKNLMLMRALGVEDLQVAFPLKLPRTVTGDTVAAGFGSEGYAADQSGCGVAEQALAAAEIRRARRGDPRADRRAIARPVGAGRGRHRLARRRRVSAAPPNSLRRPTSSTCSRSPGARS